jgi:hypothetical protein
MDVACVLFVWGGMRVGTRRPPPAMAGGGGGSRTRHWLQLQPLRPLGRRDLENIRPATYVAQLPFVDDDVRLLL